MAKEIEIIARAIIIDDSGQKMLFCAPKSRRYFYLPGGHIEFGERAEDALRREIFEETGISLNVDSFIFAGAGEEMFTQEGEDKHEMNVYFRIPYSQEMENIVSREDAILFEWIPISDLHTLPILPLSVKNIAKKAGVFWNASE